ncbi:MAG: hypothetical protein JST35_10180 [Armatimonadetes bacterium]|nr:hypothetical protein [Armatimonadota bacterium]
MKSYKGRLALVWGFLSLLVGLLIFGVVGTVLWWRSIGLDAFFPLAVAGLWSKPWSILIDEEEGSSAE